MNRRKFLASFLALPLLKDVPFDKRGITADVEFLPYALSAERIKANEELRRVLGFKRLVSQNG